MSSRFNISCPKCQSRLRFETERQPGELMELRCSQCQGVFSVRIPGTRANAPTATVPRLGGTQSTHRTAVSSPPPLFSEGDLLARRFRITRFIASGGMGEVYEAEDVQLRERVALKTVRPQISDDEVSMERFRREIQLSRKVTHPNVCRIFDLFHHQGPEGEVAFLSMELLEGETLSDKLKRETLLGAEAALPIARQMAEALGAAHRAGVIHRDLKSSNVMLVGDDGDLRVVITDFGIARGAPGTGEFAQTLTTGGTLGSPAYISPEQVEGGPITPTADIYAFGILLFEMRTGHLPFKGDTLLSTAVKRLTEPAPSPRVHLPEIEPRWEVTIARCLERRSEDRFASADEAFQSLISTPSRPAPSSPLPTPAPAPPPVITPKAASVRPASNPWVVAGLVGIILLSGVVGYLRHVELKEKRSLVGDLVPVDPADVIPRRSVAVLDFRNLSGFPGRAWLSNALAEMVSTELGSSEDLRVVSRVNVARTQIDLALEDQGDLDRGILTRVYETLGADLVVFGSYVSPEDSSSLEVSVTVHDTANGIALGSSTERGSVDDLFTLVAGAGSSLRQDLGLATADAGDESSASAPSSTEAARLYSEGLSRLRQFDAQEARPYLEQAIATEPTNALAHSALSSALAALGYEKSAQEEARLAFAHSTNLPDQERLWVEARYREMTGEWERAMEIFRSLWRSYPDDVEYGLRLAEAQTAAGQGISAQATAGALRQLPAPASEDPRIDLAAAAAAGSMSDFQQQRAAAGAAAEKAATLGAGLLLAEARVVEGDALRNMGSPQEAVAAAEEGMKLYAEAGDDGGVAFALTTIANALFDQGDLDGALSRFEEARATYRQSGDPGNEARTLNNMAVVVQSRGDLVRAEELYEAALERCLQVESLLCEASTLNNLGGVDFRRGRLSEAKRSYLRAAEVYQTLGDKGGEAYALDNLAVVLRQQGDLTRAQAQHRRTLGIRRQIGHRSGEISSLINLGKVQLYRGDLTQARVSYEQALALSEEIGNKSLTAKALFGIGDLHFQEGRLEEAQGTHEQALDLRAELGERSAGAESRLALARLSVELDDAAKSIVLAQGAVAEFQREQLVDNEALAHSVLARALSVQKMTEESLQEIERSEVLAQLTESRPVGIAVAIAVADLLTDAEQYESASDALRASLAGLDKDDFFPLRIEAELALARIEARSGGGRRGQARMQAAAQSARERGFELLARKADAERGVE